jgi:hypothetical protein
VITLLALDTTIISDRTRIVLNTPVQEKGTRVPRLSADVV